MIHESNEAGSAVAEFAQMYHAQTAPFPQRIIKPIELSGSSEILTDIRAVVFDVYGTLIQYWRSEFSSEDKRQQAILDAFGDTIRRFRCEGVLSKINPDTEPASTLRDFYHGLIQLNHEKSLQKGLTFPEVRIEEVWLVILLMMKRHGFDPAELHLGDDREVARCMAYYYNARALDRRLYAHVVQSLSTLQESNIKLGILSNAQFYTPIDLTLLMRDQSENRLDDYLDIFSPDLVVFSYEEGVAKPNPQLFQRLYDALYESHILPEQTLFVGNDLAQDIEPAQRIGLKTAFFAGDSLSAFTGESAGHIIPDLVFTDFADLPNKVSFYNPQNTADSIQLP